MELPIVAFPTYIEEMSTEFAGLFRQGRQLNQFKRVVTAFPLAERCTIAHMNGLFTHHTNQSNLNRLVTESRWKIEDIIRIKIDMLNRVEGKGIVVIDDYLVEKYGKEIYGVDWHHDHAKGRKVWGIQVADCVLSGKGINPLLSTVYVRKGSRWLASSSDFRTKIEIQKEHLSLLVKMDLQFSCVVMDKWYFCKGLADHIEDLKKDWITLEIKQEDMVSWEMGIPFHNTFAQEMRQNTKLGFRVVKVGNDKYLMKDIS